MNDSLSSIAPVAEVVYRLSLTHETSRRVAGQTLDTVSTAHAMPRAPPPVRDLLTCSGMNILVFADDSSSMQAVSCTADVYKPTTRWMELKAMLEKLVTMMLVIDHAGFDLKFFNDPTWYNVQTVSSLDDLFASKGQPRGMTPLLSNLSPSLRSRYTRGDFPEADTLVLCLTDGQPSDTNMLGLARAVADRSSGVWVSFIMCTEEDAVVNAYEKLIDPLPGVDICDDYASERAQCMKKKNDLSFNMYLAKVSGFGCASDMTTVPGTSRQT